MDFSVLSRYDDMLASYFVDGLYLWYDTLRMNGDFVGTTVDKEQVVTIIRKYLVEESSTNKAIKDAVDNFLKIPYFKKYIKGFSPKQLNEFTQHMKRYLFMYRPDAGFEVGSTSRYTGKPEACILATKDWRAGEQVTCCLGSIAALSAQDDLKLKKEGRDFSVMVSIRKKCACLFLGPARFMNHDCDSNCEFILISQTAITFRVIRDIPKGEEMTVYYADHYFGDDNCECLCSSCERLQQGHFSPQSSEENTVATPSDFSEIAIPDENMLNNTRRSGRKRKEISYKDYYVPNNVKRTKPNTTSDVSTKSTALHEITNVKTNDDEATGVEIIKSDTNTPTNSSTQQTQQLLDDQTQIPSIDEWVYMPAGAHPRQYIQNQSQFDFINGIQMEQIRVHKVRPVPGEHILYVYPPLPHQAYIPNPSQQSITSSFQIKPPPDPDVQYVYDWTDTLSDISEEESFNPDNLKCCPQAKEYCMSRISEDSTLCGRCNRHYQIYGLVWPFRKTKKPKGSKRTSTPQPEPSQPQKRQHIITTRTTTTSRKRNITQPTTIVENAAVESKPMIITSQGPLLPIQANVPIYQDELEKSRAMALQARALPKKTYHVISLDQDIMNSRDRLNYLTLQQQCLVDLKARLAHEFSMQQDLLALRDHLQNEVAQQEKRQEENVNAKSTEQQVEVKQDDDTVQENMDTETKSTFIEQQENMESVDERIIKEDDTQEIQESTENDDAKSACNALQENLESVNERSEDDATEEDMYTDNKTIPVSSDDVENISTLESRLAQDEIPEDDTPEIQENMDIGDKTMVESSDIETISTIESKPTQFVVEMDIIDVGVMEAEHIVEQRMETAQIMQDEQSGASEENVIRTEEDDDILTTMEESSDAEVNGYSKPMEDEISTIQTMEDSSEVEVSDQSRVTIKSEKKDAAEETTWTPPESSEAEVSDQSRVTVKIEQNDIATVTSWTSPESSGAEVNHHSAETVKSEQNDTAKEPIPPEATTAARKMSIQSLLAPEPQLPSSPEIDPVNQDTPTTTNTKMTTRQSISSRRPSTPVHNTPIVYIEIPVEPEKVSPQKTRPIIVVPKAPLRKAPIRKGCPIAPPSKEPYIQPIKKKLNSDPPPPRSLPLPTRSQARRITTTGPFVPNEY